MSDSNSQIYLLHILSTFISVGQEFSLSKEEWSSVGLNVKELEKGIKNLKEMFSKAGLPDPTIPKLDVTPSPIPCDPELELLIEQMHQEMEEEELRESLKEFEWEQN